MPIYAHINIHFKNAPGSALKHSKSRTKASQQQCLNETSMWCTEPWEAGIQSWDVLQKVALLAWERRGRSAACWGSAAPVWEYGACLHCFVLTVFKISCFTHNAVHGCYMGGYICHHVCWAHLNMLFSIMLSFLGRFRSTNTIAIHSFVGENKSTLGNYQTAKKPKNKQLSFSNTFGSHEPLVLPYNDIKKK